MTWISPQEAASILLCDVSTIRRKVKSGELGSKGFRYITGAVGRGGKRLEILLEALPAEAQTAYHD